MKDFNTKIFTCYSLDWLKYITKCRQGKDPFKDCDIVFGPIANDKVFLTLELYFKGEITASAAIKKLKFTQPNNQYCFKNQNVIDKYLIFKDVEEI